MSELISWFDRGAAAHPGTPALVAGGVTLTYAELDAAVTTAAAALAGDASPVAVVGARTADTYVAYLAVLRSERTVVPLNPAFPAVRTRQMVDRAGVGAVLGPAAELPGPSRPLPGTRWSVRTAAGSAPNGAEYVLFTSGTTGTPKGIPIRGAQVAAFLEHVVPARGIGPGERASQCFDLTFDPSVFDLFTTWAAGGTVVVPSREQLRDPVAFAAAERIVHWSSVPSVVSLAGRLRRLRPGVLPDLRTSWFAGEALTLEQARAWQGAAPHGRVTNAYGPTELTITCTAYTLPAAVGDWPATRNGTVPIGRPYPVVAARVEAGELWLAGPQRFGGYLDPADDAGRFSGEWFRTGDAVAGTPDGFLHLGRLDQQVQVNGYRVELSEVEGALRRHPAVDDAVALLAGGELVAVHTGRPDEPAAILDAVGTRLPPYMVPSRLYHEPALPLNANGKIDRRLVAAGLPGGGPS